jgi:kojibiose phosphorylase
MVSLPLDVDVKDFAKTQLIKQADVVMLFWLLQDKFDHDIKSKNYEYYQRRTLHSSSLSPSVYSIVGAEIGRMREAFWFFLYSLYMDLKNLHGSTHGIHAASLGGTWQAFMNGFMGMMVEDEILSFNPRLPRRWKEVRFKVRWHDLEFSVTAYQDRLRILYNDPKHIRQRLEIKIYGKIRELDANKEVTFHK